jgi:uncharacterized protein YbjT (DUF2867 family)
MRIVAIGGNGLTGSTTVATLRARGHDAVAASRGSGVDAITGAGLADALSGADVVLDVLSTPALDDASVLRFFETSTRNLLAAEAAARVRHHVALSVVGLERLPDSGYFRAKLAQEKLIERGGIPYTIVRATQFFEFIETIAQASTQGDVVRLPDLLMQPIAAADVSAALVEAVLAPPRNGIVEIAGPEPLRLDDLARRVLRTRGSTAAVVLDRQVGFFGARADDRALVAGPATRLGATRFAEWLERRAR